MPTRILLIEDKIDVLNAAKSALEVRGYHVDTARNPREINTHLETSEEKRTPYDAYLADYYLDYNRIHIHGTDTYQMLRISSEVTIPIIAASSDIIMWEKLKAKVKDPYLHPIAKDNGEWDMFEVIKKLTELGIHS